MLSLDEFKKNFTPYNAPEKLIKLLEFENESDGKYYSAGFELLEDDKDGLKQWSEDETFLNQLFPFAQANGSGSFYAIWKNREGNLDEMPIVIFGDEGGEHIVAENIPDLLQILTYDSEPLVDWDGVSFYKDEEDYEPSEAFEAYKKWTKENFDLDPITDPEEMVNEAQENYQASFKEWLKKYGITE